MPGTLEAWRRWVVGALVVVLAALLWHVASTSLLATELFPTPGATAAAFRDLVVEPGSRAHAIVTLRRLAAGFGIGSVAGVMTGFLIGLSRSAKMLSDPYIHFLRFITPIAWIAPTTIWFGIGEWSRIVLVVYATIFIVSLNTSAGVGEVSPNQVRMAQTFGAGPHQILTSVVLPACLPYALNGMRLGMGNALMTVVAVEMLGSSMGVGYLAYSARSFFRFDVMFAVIVLLGLVGSGADRVFVWLRSLVFGRYVENFR